MDRQIGDLYFRKGLSLTFIKLSAILNGFVFCFFFLNIFIEIIIWEGYQHEIFVSKVYRLSFWTCIFFIFLGLCTSCDGPTDRFLHRLFARLPYPSPRFFSIRESVKWRGQAIQAAILISIVLYRSMRHSLIVCQRHWRWPCFTPSQIKRGGAIRECSRLKIRNQKKINK